MGSDPQAADDRIVRTVRGDVPASALGITLAHEHLFLDLRNQFREPADEARRALAREPVSDAHRELLARNPYALVDNLVLDSMDDAVAELRPFAVLGGRSVVDCTSRTLGRDPVRLRELAERTGLNVVAGCGLYTADTHPADVTRRSAASLAEDLIAELTEGIDGTPIRAGVIGEVGTSAELLPGERLGLQAAALAQRAFPAAIHVHTYPWARAALEAVDVLIAAGADPGSVIVDHLDVDIDLPYIEELLRRGVVAELDCFGKEYPLDASDDAFAAGRFATDAERIDTLVRLLDAGWLDQLLIATDICFKTLLVRYGGRGYAYVLEGVVPMLRARGADDATVDALLVSNPARLYSVPADAGRVP
jgi:phosphotriesterase-related protein